MPVPCIRGAMNNSAKNQSSWQTQLNAQPTISPSSSATQSPAGSSLKENSWKAAGRTEAIAPNPCRWVRSLMLLTISSCARCNSPARASLNVTDITAPEANSPAPMLRPTQKLLQYFNAALLRVVKSELPTKYTFGHRPP